MSGRNFRGAAAAEDACSGKVPLFPKKPSSLEQSRSDQPRRATISTEQSATICNWGCSATVSLRAVAELPDFRELPEPPGPRICYSAKVEARAPRSQRQGTQIGVIWL